MEYPNELDAKTLICEYARRVYARQFVAGNEGNLSCRTGENEIWITPTMESKGYLTPDMLVKLDLAGNVLSTPYLPSSESKMHIGLYNENPNITAVVHAHPPFATAIACCGKSISSLLMPEPILQFGREIAVAPFAMPGTDEVPDSVKPYAKSHRALLLGNHGALTWAATLKEAFFCMEILEQYCKIYMIANKFIGDPNPVPEGSAESLIMYHEKIMEDLL